MFADVSLNSPLCWLVRFTTAATEGGFYKCRSWRGAGSRETGGELAPSLGAKGMRGLCWRATTYDPSGESPLPANVSPRTTLPAPSNLPEAMRPTRGHQAMQAWMFLMTLCWGANVIAGKVALRSFDVLPLTTLRMTGAAAVLLVACFARRNRLPLRLSTQDWFFLSVVALFGTTLNQFCFTSGLARTSATSAGLIAALGPLIVLAVSCLLGMEALTVLKVSGVLISCAGVSLLSMNGPNRHGGSWVANLILLAGISSFSCYTILVKRLVSRFDALTLSTVMCGLGAAFMIPIGAQATLSVHWATVPLDAWWGLIYMVFFGSAIPYVIHTYAMTELTASRVAVFGYLQPVIATLLAFWVLSEKIGAAVIFAGALILLGLYLAERDPAEENESR